MLKNIFLPSLLFLLLSFSCGKKQNNVANDTNVLSNVESIPLPETLSSEEPNEDDLDKIIRSKNENYHAQIKDSPYRKETMAIDSARIEKNFSEFLKNFGYSDYYEKKEKPRTAEEKSLKQAFEKTFNSYIKKIKKKYEESEYFGFYSSFHIINDINGDTIKDGYVRFEYSEGLLANLMVGNAFFIQKDGEFEFLQSIDPRGFGWSEESPDNIIEVKNKLIYATSNEHIDSDARCCPSIEIKKVFKMIDNKIVEIYRIYSKNVYE